MISILIPSYNYNTVSLVEELHRQAILQNVEFEIIVADDASPKNKNTEFNSKINQISNCHFYTNFENLGRGRNINAMISKANYSYILLMDCDTLPEKENFIKNYVSEIKKELSVVFGGIIYQTEKPKQENLLRWVYGQNREALTREQRNVNPYFSTLTSNILFKKEIFLANLFDENITNYGYEDVVWVKRLKEKSIIISHIDNPAYHLNLETSKIFIKKIHESLENLKLISSLGLITSQDNRILKTHKRISEIGVSAFFRFLYNQFHTHIESNLESNHPNLFLLDIYKLGYFCKINSK